MKSTIYNRVAVRCSELLDGHIYIFYKIVLFAESNFFLATLLRYAANMVMGKKRTLANAIQNKFPKIQIKSGSGTTPLTKSNMIAQNVMVEITICANRIPISPNFLGKYQAGIIRNTIIPKQKITSSAIIDP